MSNKLRKAGRKFVAVFVSGTTALWLTGSAFLMPVAVNAQTTAEDLQALIDSLMAQITSLQQQILVLQGGGGSPSGFSHVWSADLAMGDDNADVAALQQALDLEGCFNFDSYTGYYGPITAAGVTCFQETYASEVLTPLGLAGGTGYFGPSSRTKLNALYSVPVGPPPPPPEEGEEGEPAPAGTGLTVSAGSHAPASIAPNNAINLPFTSVNFTASADGDVVVDSLTIERQGLGDDTPISGVVLLDENGNRVNNVAKTLNSVHQAVITTDFTVPAGTTREMTIAADMAASNTAYAGQLAYLALVAVNTTAQVNGSLPIVGNVQTINATVTLGTVTLSKGSLDPSASPSKKVGTTDYAFTSIKASANATEDVLWKSIAFNQSGSAAVDDLENVVVKDGDGNSYPTVVSQSGKYYTATLGDGILIKKGKNAEVTIYGDIVSGSARTIDFDLYKYEHATFTGMSNGFDIKPTASQTTADNDDDSEFQDADPRFDASQVTIASGSLTVTKANTVAAQNVTAGGSQVTLGAFEFEAKGEPVSFTQWVVTVTTTSASAADKNEPTNLTVYDANDSVVAGPTDVTGTSVTLSDTVTVPVGKNIYTAKADIDSNWTSNDTIYLKFTPSSALSNVLGENTGNTITPTPSSSVQGPTMTVKAGALKISPSGSFASSTVIANATDVEVGRLVLDANDSGDDVKITVAKLRKHTNAGNSLDSIVLKDGTTELNSAVSTADSASETLTFTLTDPLVIPKGTSKTISIIGDIGSTATGSSFYSFDTGSGGSNLDWTVKTSTDGQDVTETFGTNDPRGITIQTTGGYKVEADASKPNETWVADGSTGVTLNVLKFTATSEPMAITDLRLQIDTTGSSSASDFVAVELWDGGTLVQRKDSPTFDGGVEDFDLPISGTGSFVIPADTSKLLTVKADLATIGIGLAGKAGQLVGLDYDGADSTKQKATGLASNSSVHSSTASDATGNGVVTFRAVPVVSKDTSLSNSAAGSGAIYRLKVKAEGGDIKLNRITAIIATSNINALDSTANIRLYSVTKGDYISTATVNAAAYLSDLHNYDGSNRLVVRLLANNTGGTAVNTNGEYEIASGIEHTLEVRADAYSDDGTAGGSLITFIAGDAARPVNVSLTGSGAQTMANVGMIDIEQGDGYGIAGNAASSTNFIWSDLSSEATSSSNTNATSTADWMNGFKILPTTGLDTQVLQF